MFGITFSNNITEHRQKSRVMTGYTWVASSHGRAAPPRAVQAGQDADGSLIYAGRAFFHGDTLPCKIVPQRREAYVSHNGREHNVSNYEYLVEQHMQWVSSSGSYIPPGAVPAGHTSSGETLYLGRVRHGNSITVGKVHPSHGCLYIPFGGNEVNYNSYEILVMR
ncbi:hypothetical protein PPYR_09220 [Photinus pyralis]|uniref:Uncharacterized protein n=1 Tax=Photinus pyralis TaxID=7054 RepID=A0A5N4ALN2_PHOPY|nr:uncharacterized protein LOC116172034 [Photinus pyralis]KAB0798227.1 hypothetical protein PPYR_09220 [Photinus pyralis]